MIGKRTIGKRTTGRRMIGRRMIGKRTTGRRTYFTKCPTARSTPPQIARLRASDAA
jgi:hypothetical protein